MNGNSFSHDIQQHTNDCYRKMRIINAMLEGALTHQELVKYAKRHYAEVRTFIDLKLPSRLRICPHNANSAKRFFWDIYYEEQGNFEEGKNHADLFKPVCHKLGITDEELELEFNNYYPNYNFMLTIPPSYPALVRELAISYAWESLLTKLGDKMVHSLKNDYGFEAGDILYFTVHTNVDQEHSQHALNILTEYVTNRTLEHVAFEAITDSLIHNSYLDI